MVLDQWLLGLIVLALIWSTVLTVLFLKQSSHYKRLLGKGSGDLRAILEKILLDRKNLEEHIKQVEDSLNNLDKRSLGFIQKIGLVRFSPYAETGGNQSFAICLLDGEDNGIIILSLHGRESTRIYVKPVERGKSKLELSKEEQQALDEARKD